MSQMFLNVVSTFKGEGIQQATRQLGAFGKQTSSFGSILGKVGGALAAFGVATKAVQFGRESITAARDLERNLYALNTVFDDLAPGMKTFAKDAENIGLSQSKAAKASVFIGSVLKQSGFAMNDVAKETKNLVTLGTDLAALYGYDVQEALLGMTALFRGEYDPIEKFGVAMKQSEINAELAARGQDKLEGAARRNAEQTIRLELLYQRAADAMGAFTGQSGSLYTEQKKLGATFENMQAQLGTALLPAIVDVNEQLRIMLTESTPFLIEVFNGLAEVLEGIVGLFIDAMDATTPLGESFTALGIQFDSLLKTIFGQDFSIASVFDAAAVAIEFVLDFLHDVMFIIERLVIGLQVMGEQIGALISLDFDKLFNTDWDARIRGLIGVTEATKDFKLQSETATDAVKDLRNSVVDADKAKLDNLKEQLFGIKISARESANELRRFRQQAGLKDIADTIATVDTDLSSSTGSGSSSATKNTRTTMADLMAQVGKASPNVQKTVGRLNAISAAIRALGETTVKKAEAVRAALRKEFAEEDALASLQLKASEAALAAEEAAKREAELLAERERQYASFADAIKSTFSQIKNSIMGAFDLQNLGGSTSSIIRNMKKLLETTKTFASNISKLSNMGLNPMLLQQVMSAGPLAGAKLANALVSGGMADLMQINAGYSEFGQLASNIAEAGTRRDFETSAQQSIYNINVEGGVGSGATIGKAIVDAIKAYERTSGAVWQGA
jgi:hypothetical protein